jgi:hypothetical protein
MHSAFRPLASALLVSSLAFFTRDARAVGTRTFVLDTLEKLSGGDLEGVSVGSDGVVRAGFTLGNTPLPDATGVFSSLVLADGSVLVGTSPSGKVFRIVGDQATLYADTGELGVTSLALGPGGAVFAATIPEGKVYRLSQGKADVFGKAQDGEYVWALATDKTGGLLAATGPNGKLFRFDAAGKASVLFDSDEPHLVSLAVDAKSGDAIVGSSGKAILFRVAGPGRATVLHDFPGDEVKAVAVANDGSVFAAVNEYSEPPEPPRRTQASARTPPGPSGTARPKPGKGALYRLDPQGRPERLMKHDEFHYLAMGLDAGGLPYVGTGAEGRVYTVDDAHAVTLVADTDERQVGALAFSPRAGGAPLLGIVSGDPAVYHRVVARGGADAVWTSKVLDTGLRAQFGQLGWRATGALELSTRTGNTATPDATWSPWSPPLTSPGKVQSPPGRYVQVRSRFSRDPNATLREVTLPFVTDNIRPVLTEVSAQQKGLTRDSKEGLVASGGEAPKRESVVRITWKVDNPDADTLRYRVTYRREGQTIWRDVLRADEIVTKTEHEWDTLALPEGYYRVRVEASDELSNPPELVLRHALESSTFAIDNTPPVLQGLTMQGRRLRVRVVDGLGPIARVELSVDGRLDFRPLRPADGIFDTADETVDTDVASLVPPGSHIVTVRAYDAAGNAVVGDVEAR